VGGIADAGRDLLVLRRVVELEVDPESLGRWSDRRHGLGERLLACREDLLHLRFLERGSVEPDAVALRFERREPALPLGDVLGVVAFRARVPGRRPRPRGLEHPLPDDEVVVVHRPVGPDAR